MYLVLNFGRGLVLKSGKIYDFIPWISDILYADYCFCFHDVFGYELRSMTGLALP